MNEFKKIPQPSKANKATTITRKASRTWETNKDQVRSILPSIYVLSFLALWISLSYNSNLFLKEVLICSSLIVSLLFFGAAKQNGDLNKYD